MEKIGARKEKKVVRSSNFLAKREKKVVPRYKIPVARRNFLAPNRKFGSIQGTVPSRNAIYR
ncbi:MAG: hypothetical protein AB7S48_04815 [Bacteroidales bacterium]